MDYTLIAVVAVALFFDFTNGFHDTANAIATSVATRAIPPKIAVIGAAILNFLGAFVSLAVAATVAKGIVDSTVISLEVILAGVIGAIIWNLTTWRFGMPTSSSHALIGGVAGSAIAAAGFSVVFWDGILNKVLIPSLAAPLLGVLIAGAIAYVIYHFTKEKITEKINRNFRKLQLVSASFVAFTHGTNDAQKTMGIIALALLISNPGSEFNVPLWVIVSSAAAMAIGTYLGGWRIIHTLGHRLVKLEPQQGFAAETATAGILFSTAQLGFPVSTTHTISGSIIGAGAASGKSKVKWRVVRHILIAWVITLPAAALVGAIMEGLIRISGESYVALSVAILLGSTIYVTRNWTWESMEQVRVRLALLQKIRRKPKKV